MTPYLPESPSSREALAIKLLAGLTQAGFKPIDVPECEEAVYERVGPHKSGRVTIRVYTTVIPARGTLEVRPSGSDAIRVAVLYTSKRALVRHKERGLNSEVRVHRTGQIEEIAERMLERMRSSWAWVQRDLITCDHCDAPSVKTRNNRMCCCDLCFKTDAELEAENPSRQYQVPRPKIDPRQAKRYHCAVNLLEPVPVARFCQALPHAKNVTTQDGGKTFNFVHYSPLSKEDFERFVQQAACRTTNRQMAMVMTMS